MMFIFPIVVAMISAVSPTVEDAFENDAIRGALLYTLGDRTLGVGDIDIRQVKYLTIGSWQLYDDRAIPVTLLVPFRQLRSLSAELVLFEKTEAFKDLDSLRELALWGCDFSSLQVLSEIPNLTHLTLRSMDISGEDTSFLGDCRYLRFVDLRNNAITTLEPFQKLATLERIDIRGNPIPQADIEAFRVARPEIELLSGPWPVQDEYVRRAWIARRGSIEWDCAPRIIAWHQDGGWKGRLPWQEEDEHGVRILDAAAETDHYAGTASVIVRYAKYFRDNGHANYCFRLDDPRFACFLKQTQMRPDNAGAYPLEYTVNWIRVNRAKLAPLVLLDDMLALWDQR